MDWIETYLIEVVGKNLIPKVAAAAIAAAVGWLLSHAGMLEAWGVTTGTWPLHWTSEPTGPVTVIEWDTLTVAGGAGLMGLLTLIAGIVMHHGKATVAGTPQSGDLRKTPDVPLSGGNRAGDTPAGGQS